jgi:hypothetical protein
MSPEAMPGTQITEPLACGGTDDGATNKKFTEVPEAVMFVYTEWLKLWRPRTREVSIGPSRDDEALSMLETTNKLDVGHPYFQLGSRGGDEGPCKTGRIQRRLQLHREVAQPQALFFETLDSEQRPCHHNKALLWLESKLRLERLWWHQLCAVALHMYRADPCHGLEVGCLTNALEG